MGRGKSFNHKRKGHEQEVPAHGREVESKRHEEVVYNIEPVASEGRDAVSTKVIEE